jgi:hypothetical protein
MVEVSKRMARINGNTPPTAVYCRTGGSTVRYDQIENALPPRSPLATEHPSRFPQRSGNSRSFNDRCLNSNSRWPLADPAPVHPAVQRTTAPDGAGSTRAALATTTAHHRSAGQPRPIAHPSPVPFVVKTSWQPSLIPRHLSWRFGSNCESQASAGLATSSPRR